jgi:hypothetical protein
MCLVDQFALSRVSYNQGSYLYIQVNYSFPKLSILNCVVLVLCTNENSIMFRITRELLSCV